MHPLHIEQLRGKAFKVFTETRKEYDSVKTILIHTGFEENKTFGFSNKYNMGIRVKGNLFTDGYGNGEDLPTGRRIQAYNFIAANQGYLLINKIIGTESNM